MWEVEGRTEGTLDGLIRYLLDEIALCGAQGAFPSDILKFLSEYHSKAWKQQEPQSQSRNPEVEGNQAVPELDKGYQSQVWQWLIRHPDVSVGINGEGNGMSLAEVEAYNNKILTSERHPRTHSDAKNGNLELVPDDGAYAANSGTIDPETHSVHKGTPDNAPTPRQKDDSPGTSILKVRTSQDRMWFAVAGHGPDLDKIPLMEFVCLSIIAAHREHGILQPDLVILSGQDKRSVPPRTQRLFDKGYIEKTPVLSKGSRTSLCTLKRFAIEAGAHRISRMAKPTGSIGDAPTWPPDSIFHAVKSAIREMFRLLRDLRIIIWDDLKKKVDVWRKAYESKMLALAVRKLEGLGFVQRVRAMGSVPRPSRQPYRCVKLLREPTAEEWAVFYRMQHSLTETHTTIELNDNNEDKEFDGGGDQAVEFSAQDIVKDENIQDGDNEVTERGSLPWTPDQPFVSFLRKAIHESGTNAMSLSNIKSRAIGPFFDRPLETQVARLVEVWQLSQPLHLRHLAVIRDTTMTGKISHYVHYSYPAFKSLVETGVACWEAVETIKTAKSSKSAKETSQFAVSAVPDLDEYGLPRLEIARFQGRYNDATLAETVAAADIGTFYLGRQDTSLVNCSDGTFEIRWGLPWASLSTKTTPKVRNSQDVSISRIVSGNRSGSRSSKVLQVVDNRIEDIEKLHEPLGQRPYNKRKFNGKPRGRPRKYPKIGLPENADTLTPEHLDVILKSQMKAKIYEQNKLESEVEIRVLQGQDETTARNEVVAEITAANAVGHQITGSVTVQHMRPSPKKNRQGRPKRLPSIPATPYLPSIIAHSFPSNVPVDSTLLAINPTALKGQALSRTRKRPLRSKRFSGTLGYFPSVLAHTTPRPYSRSMPAAASKRRVNPNSHNLDAVQTYRTLPSIAAHSILSCPHPRSGPNPIMVQHKSSSIKARITRTFAPNSRKRAIDTEINPGTQSSSKRRTIRPDNAASPSNQSLGLDFIQYLPPVNVESYSTFLETEILPPVKESLVEEQFSLVRTKISEKVKTADSARSFIEVGSTNTEKRSRPCLGYDEQLRMITRPGVGIYVGPLVSRQHLKGRGRPRKSRLVVFKSPLLTKLKWTRERSMSDQNLQQMVVESGRANEASDTNHQISLSLSTSRTRLLPHSSNLDPSRPPISHKSKHLGEVFADRRASFEPTTLVATASPLFSTNESLDRLMSSIRTSSTILNGPTVPYVSPYLQPDNSPIPSVQSPLQSYPYSRILYPANDLALSASIQKKRKRSDTINSQSSAPVELPSGQSPSAQNVASGATGSLPYVGESLDSGGNPNRPAQRLQASLSPLEDVPASAVLGLSASPSSSSPPPSTQGKKVLILKYTSGADRFGEAALSQANNERMRLLPILSELDMQFQPISDNLGPVDVTKDPCSEAAQSQDSQALQTNTSRTEVAMDRNLKSLGCNEDPLPHTPRDPNNDRESILEKSWSGLMAAPAVQVLPKQKRSTTQHNDKLSQTEQDNLPDPAIYKLSTARDAEMIEQTPHIVKITPTGGSMAVLRRQIIMEIIEKCHGVFPGDKEIWHPFCKIWVSRTSSGQPDQRTVQLAMKALIDTGKLRKLKFTFQNKLGIATTRSLVTLSSMSTTDPKVKELEKKLIEKDPQLYFPPEAGITLGLGRGSFHFRPSGVEEKVEVQYLPASLRRSETGLAVGRSIEERRRKMEEKRKEKHERLLQEELGEADFEIPGYSHTGAIVGSEAAGSSKFMLPWAVSKENSPKRRSRPTSRLIRPRIATLAPGTSGPQVRQPRAPRLLRLPPKAGPMSDRTNRISREQADAMADEYLKSRSRVDDHTMEEKVSVEKRLKLERPKIQFMDVLGLNSNFDHYPPLNPPERVDLRGATTSFVNLADTRVESPGIGDRAEYQTGICHSSSLAFRASQVSPKTIARQAWEIGVQYRESAHKYRSKIQPLHHQRKPTHSPLSAPHTQHYPLSLMDPEHIFHSSTGTFSVDYPQSPNVPKPVQLSMLAVDVSNTLPINLEDILNQHHTSRSGEPLTYGPRSSSVDEPLLEQIDIVMRWELGTPGLADVIRKDWRFINFRLNSPLEEATEGCWDLELAKDDQRNKRGRKSTARQSRSEMSPPKVNEGKRKVAELSQNSRNIMPLIQPSMSQPNPQNQNLRKGLETESIKHLRLRGPRQSIRFGPETDRRLMVSVVVVRVLTGGLELNIDWALVEHIFDSRFTEKLLHQRWTWLQARYRVVIDKMQRDFQEEYLKAYHDRTIPAINYDKLGEYDWKHITEWTLGKLEEPMGLIPGLPATREQLDELFELRDLPRKDISEFYEIEATSPVPKRRAVIHRDPYVIPLQDAVSEEAKVSKLDIARSWVRGSVITPEQSFSAVFASKKLNSLGDNTVETAIKELLSLKVIMQQNKGRLVPGRNYDISDSFVSRLRKNLNVGDYKRAAVYKAFLDKEISNNRVVEYSWHATNGDVMAVQNLLDKGRINLKQKNVPMDSFGLLDSGYRTRTMDKSRLHFALEIIPSPSYVHGNPLLPLPPLPGPQLLPHAANIDPRLVSDQVEAASSTSPPIPLARLPTWIDINNNSVSIIWELALAAVLTIMVTRPMVGHNEIEKYVKPSLDAWEIKLIMEWCVTAGVGTWAGVDGVRSQNGGVILEEWWWLALGSGTVLEGENAESEIMDSMEQGSKGNDDLDFSRTVDDDMYDMI